MTLDELRDQIFEDQITRDDVIAALREPLAETDNGYLRSKLKQAITLRISTTPPANGGRTEPLIRRKLD